MTKLDQLIEAVRKLPAERQEHVAERWLGELDAQDAGPAVDETLPEMLERVSNDVRAGKVEKIGWDQL
jgi:hypothetical protein